MKSVFKQPETRSAHLEAAPITVFTTYNRGQRAEYLEIETNEPPVKSLREPDMVSRNTFAAPN